MPRRKSSNPVKGIPITIDGIEYSSIQDAANQLGINRSVIDDRMRSSKWPDYVGPSYIIKEERGLRGPKTGKEIVRKKPVSDINNYIEIWRKTSNGWYCCNKTETERKEYDDKWYSRRGYYPVSVSWNDFNNSRNDKGKK